MARTAGTPLTESELEIHVTKDCVLRDGKRRYVFIDVLSPKIHRLSRALDGTTRLYIRYSQILHREMYNIKMFYGLRAINIDTPQKEEHSISVRLKIVTGEGKDEVQKNF